MELMTKEDFYDFVNKYLEEVENHRIEEVFFLFSCGYTEKEAKESNASLERIVYSCEYSKDPAWVWGNDWDEGARFVYLYGVCKESDVIKMILNHPDSNTKEE